MKKLMIAIAGAVALGTSAWATDTAWFNQGTLSGWPTSTTATYAGGDATWSGTDGSTAKNVSDLASWDSTDSTLKVDTDGDQLVLTATTPKTISEATSVDSVTFNAEMTFNSYEEAPAIPSDAKAGIALIGNKFWVAKYDTAGMTNTWADTGIAGADGFAYDVEVTIYTNEAHDVSTKHYPATSPVTYKIVSNDTTIVNADYEIKNNTSDSYPTASAAVLVGTSSLTSLSAKYSFDVKPINAKINIATGASVESVTDKDGNDVTYDKENSIVTAVPGTKVNIKFNTDGAYLFSDGTSQKVASWEVAATGYTPTAEFTPVAAKFDVDGDYYLTFQAAIAAAEDNSDIELLADYTNELSILINKSVTIDFGGYTLTNTIVRPLAIEGGKTVTFENGTVAFGGNGYGISVYTNSVLNLQNSMRVVSWAKSDNQPTFDIYGGTVNVGSSEEDDNTLVSSGCDIFRFKNEALTSAVNVVNATLTQPAGSVNAMFHHYKPNHNVKVTISGGTFNAKTSGGNSDYLYGGGGVFDLKVSGGENCTYDCEFDETCGATFNTDVGAIRDYVKSGCKFVKSGDAYVIATGAVAVKGVTISDETAEVVSNGVKTLSYTKTDDEGDVKWALWTTSDDSIAKVGELTGKVTGVKDGTATITLTVKDWNGNEFTKTCQITTATPHAITIADGITGGTVESDKATAKSGETVTLTVTPNAGYELGTLTVKDADDGEVVVSADYKFTMPANSAVTVTATFTAIEYTVTAPGAITGGSVTADKAKATIGETVTLTVTPADEYTIGWVKTNGVELAAVEDVYSFTMPAADVTVTAQFSQKTYAITWTDSENVVVSNGAAQVEGTSGNFAKGTVLKFYATVGSITNVTVDTVAQTVANPFEYTVGSAGATIKVLAGESGVAPIVPGGDTPTYSDKTAAEEAAKTAEVGVPADVASALTTEQQTAYKAMFTVVAVQVPGTDTYTLEAQLTTSASNEVVTAVTADTVMTSLATTASSDTPSTTVTTKPGLYYGIAGAASVDGIKSSSIAEKDWELATSTSLNLSTSKPAGADNAAFYEVRCRTNPPVSNE